MIKERFYLRAKEECITFTIIEERLDAPWIASQKLLVCLLVPDRKSKHPPQIKDDIPPPIYVVLKDDLSV